MQSKKISPTFASRSRSSSPTVTRSLSLQVMSEPRNPTHKPDSHKPDNHKPSNRKLGERLARSLTPPSSLAQLPLDQLPMGQLPMGQLPMGQLPRGQLPTVDLDDCGSCRPMRRIAILPDCYTKRARARNKALDRSARLGVFDLRLSHLLALGPCKNRQPLRDNPNVRHRWRGMVGPIIRLVDPTTPNHDRCDRASWPR